MAKTLDPKTARKIGKGALTPTAIPGLGAVEKGIAGLFGGKKGATKPKPSPTAKAKPKAKAPAKPKARKKA